MKRFNSEKEEKVYRVFENIAGGYDDANRRISMGRQAAWKQDMAERLSSAMRPGRPSVLDLCCGTGDIALSVKAALPEAAVYALDFSPAMLEVARNKEQALFGEALAPESPLRPGIRWVRGNAMDLPFEAGVFDAVTISFGLRNTPDYAGVIKEIRRVLKPSGRAYCLDSFEPENPLVLPFYKLYFSKIMPRIGGKGVHTEEYKWLNRSTAEFISPKELAGLFRQEGFREAVITRHMLGACCLIEAF